MRVAESEGVVPPKSEVPPLGVTGDPEARKQKRKESH